MQPSAIISSSTRRDQRVGLERCGRQQTRAEECCRCCARRRRKKCRHNRPLGTTEASLRVTGTDSPTWGPEWGLGCRHSWRNTAQLPRASQKAIKAPATASQDNGQKAVSLSRHIDKSVERTNLELGTHDAAALIVRIVRGWANDMAGAPKHGQDADVVLPIDLESGQCLEAARGTCHQLAVNLRSTMGALATRGFGCDDGRLVDSTTRGGWQGSGAMQVMFVLG